MKRKKVNPAKEQLYYPKLRPGLEAIEAQTREGEPVVGLADSWKITPTLLWFSRDMFALVQFLDGTHSTRDLELLYLNSFAKVLPTERLEAVLDLLDEHLFLDNDHFWQKFGEMQQDYRHQTKRNAKFAGKAYKNDPIELQRQMDSWLQSAIVSSRVINRVIDRSISAMVMPHIDPELGRKGYAAGYHLLSFTQPADMYVILGIAHQGLLNHFALTDKTFVTPFGEVQTASNVVHQIQQQCQTDYFFDEWMHQYEHTIEFQVLFLQHVLKHEFKILPILCSFSHAAEKNSREDEIVKEFCTALKIVLAGKKNVRIIASIDLAHIGPQYGDPSSPSRTDLARLEQTDRELLELISDPDPDLLKQRFCGDDNRNRICGYASLYTLLCLLKEQKKKGELISYGQAEMDEKRSTVSFASMIYF
ncbi:AmmeMemoRadiSam system protein B [candidate division KSB1 bacterium]|nr:AmmeMemoRadiSam system protein B [candidate division KSB1 bacterium]